MSVEDKKKLARSLLEEVEIEEMGTQHRHPFQESDFENPLNTCPPAINDKVRQRPACVSFLLSRVYSKLSDSIYVSSLSVIARTMSRQEQWQGD